MKSRKLKKPVKIAIAVLVIGLIVAWIVWFVLNAKKFEYSEHLSDIVITVNDTNINLKELSFYILLVEDTGNEYAKLYNPDNLIEYWNLYMNDNGESGYVTDLAKKAAINFCIRDNIYAMEADRVGITLTEEELSDIRYDSENIYFAMNMNARATTGLTIDDIVLIKTKQAVSLKYMAYLANNDGGNALEAIVLKYDVNGDYYEGLKNTFNITLDNEIIDHIRVGFVTINNN